MIPSFHVLEAAFSSVQFHLVLMAEALAAVGIASQ